MHPLATDGILQFRKTADPRREDRLVTGEGMQGGAAIQDVAIGQHDRVMGIYHMLQLIVRNKRVADVEQEATVVSCCGSNPSFEGVFPARPDDSERERLRGDLAGFGHELLDIFVVTDLTKEEELVLPLGREESRGSMNVLYLPWTVTRSASVLVEGRSR